MGRRFIQLGSLVLMTLGLWTQAASAQNGERMREWRARQQARRETAAGRGQPTPRGMLGMPGPWIQKLRDLPPDEQERFMQNNQRFQGLPPQQQQQIRKNLQKWNQLSPEEKQAARDREQWLENLPPEQREYVLHTLWPKWQAMPPPRRQIINGHLAILGKMSPATQQAALNDPKFVAGLSPDEQSMLRDLNSLRNPAPAAEQAPPQ